MTDLVELKDRLHQLEQELRRLAATKRPDGYSRTRLNAKADGVRLALSYVDEVRP